VCLKRKRSGRRDQQFESGRKKAITENSRSDAHLGMQHDSPWVQKLTSALVDPPSSSDVNCPASWDSYQTTSSIDPQHRAIVHLSALVEVGPSSHDSPSSSHILLLRVRMLKSPSRALEAEEPVGNTAFREHLWLSIPDTYIRTCLEALCYAH
jgi:hypothetical protein